MMKTFLSLWLLILFFGACLIKGPTTPISLNLNEEEDTTCYLCHDIFPYKNKLHKLIEDSTYRYKCNLCHHGNQIVTGEAKCSFHENKEGIIVVDTAYIYSYSTFSYTEGMVYKDSTCSNIPCHWTGRAGRDSVVWNKDASLNDTLDCMGCHNTTNHQRNSNCETCHPISSLNDSTIKDYSNHINGNVTYK
jgi:predicted CxxxxCH...CXXCH cytochrome family protein